MKYSRLLLATIFILLLIIPLSSAESNITDISQNSAETIDDDYPNNDVSYFENSDNVEKPSFSTDFTTFKMQITDKNTFYVNASYGGDDESGTKDKPYKTLKTAFSELSISRSVTNIYIADGIYKLNTPFSLSKNLNIIGQSSEKTIIDGSNTSQLFFVKPNNLVFNIFNITLMGGTSYYGGAISNNQSTLNVVNTIFKENSAIGVENLVNNYSGAGGAIYNEAGNCNIYNSTFINNYASSSLYVYGGALYNELGSVTIINSKFINNTVNGTDYGSAGAIYNFNGFLSVLNTTIINNTVDSKYSIGGAIYNYESHNVFIINSTISGNTLHGTYTLGSAIANKGVLLEIINSTISDNIAEGIGVENSTVYNIGGYYNLINLRLTGNNISDPRKYILMCLEDQLITSSAFDDDVLVNLPSKYDLRDENLITSVKSQGSSGACWAFTSYAALESFLLKYENITYDFSENNMKNVMNSYGVNGTDWSDGGNYQMALAYLLRWDGPISENDDAFGSYSIIPNYDVDAIKHVQGAVFVPLRMGYQDNDQIKYAIMKYGAVYTSIYGTSLTKNVYHPTALIPNHAVAIVGWDDNYPANRFTGTNKPPGNGAFIIKNSWGTSYGERGYGYVSYYDTTFAGYALDSLSVMAFTEVENVTNYNSIYQYDIIGNTFESVGYNSHEAWLANQFTANSDNPLAAFGLYTYGDSDYLAKIYVNNDLKYVQEGKLDYAGYHTVKLNKLIDLNNGDLFRIEIRLNTHDSIYPIAIETVRNSYSTKATADLNQSFISPDGIEWYDIARDTEMVKVSASLFNTTLEKTNVCLKAYTANSGNIKLNITSNASYFYKNDLVEFIFNITNTGDYISNVDFNLSLDDNLILTDYKSTKGIYNNSCWTINSLNKNENQILKLIFKISENKEKIINKAIITSNDILKNNNSSTYFNLSYAGFTTIHAQNMITLSKSEDTVDIILVDQLNNPISEKELIIKNNSYFTDKNGLVKFNLNLLEGNYTYDVVFNGDDLYKASNTTFNVTVKKRTANLTLITNSTVYYLDDILISLKEDNMSLVNKSVEVNSLTYITDNNGYVNLSGLKAGEHNLSLTFEDDYYSKSILNININIIKRNTQIIANDFSTTAVVVSVEGYTGKSFNIKLLDINGNAVINSTVQIILNKHTYDVKINNDGIGSLNINLKSYGKYTTVIVFKGDDMYNPSNGTVKITVNKKKMSLKIPKKTYKSSKKVKKVTATLKDSKGNLISNKKITFKVNGKKYSAKTNKKGVATVKVKISKKKTYKVIATFKGNKSYAKITKTGKLIIK